MYKAGCMCHELGVPQLCRARLHHCRANRESYCLQVAERVVEVVAEAVAEQEAEGDEGRTFGSQTSWSPR